VGEHTTILELSFEQLDHSLRVTFALLIVLDYLTELSNTSVEWAKVALVVHPRFVHVIQDLLHDALQVSAPNPHYQGRTGCEERDPSDGGSTHPHRGDLRVGRWAFFRLPNGHEEQRE
jgi:hypothetical protein